jgi:hypothetical protein
MRTISRAVALVVNEEIHRRGRDGKLRDEIDELRQRLMPARSTSSC